MIEPKESATHLHKDRPDLAGEHRFGDAGQIILLFVFMAVWAVDSFFVRYSTNLSSYAPVWIRLIVSAAILAAAALSARSGLRIVFGEVRSEPGVIRKGVFGVVRHPVYLGSLLFYLGLVVMTVSILSFMVLILIAGFYHCIARYEEKLLVGKFGDDYTAYLNEVPMWIPRIG